jgi:phosphatidylglycerophosphatase A
VARLIATWFGCGYARRAPGTVGSFVALFIALPLHHHAGFHRWHFLGMAAALFFPAVWAAGRVARDAKLADPQIVVVDEVIGQWIAVAGPHDLDLFTGLAAFALFRLFDIWKPPPVRQLERLPGGWGIVADDVMAGCYAAILLLLAGRFNLY